MKIRELFENIEENGSLIGKTVSGKIITIDTPNTVWDGNFSYMGKDLTSLEGAPKKVNGTFDCSNNQKLTSLKFAPEEVERFYCDRTGISSLEGIPRVINGALWCAENPNLKSLKNIHKMIDTIKDVIRVSDSIESNILGVLKIKDLKNFGFYSHRLSDFTKTKISNIINKYLPNPSPSQIIDCQNELIDAGFEEYAEL